MSKYRKKPVIIEAVQWTGENAKEIIGFCDAFAFFNKGELFLKTPENKENLFEATKGDFIIKGISGEVYACKPDIFEKTYDKID